MKTYSKIKHSVWAGLLACACINAQADAVLLGEADLVTALQNAPQCCVIDARADAKRLGKALANALAYRKDLAIQPTTSVVVVADSDKQALAVAQSLGAKHPQTTLYAVRGGVTAWESVRKTINGQQASSGAAPAAISFVIPHNTCETGTPLQILSTGPQKSKR